MRGQGRKPEIKDLTSQVFLSPKIFLDVLGGVRWVETKL